MKRAVLTAALVAIASSTASAQIITVGPHASNYTGFSRGFSYIAPVDHTITNLELPPDRFVSGDLASYLVEVDNVIANYTTGVTGAIAVNISVLAGQEVLIIGNWTSGAPGGFTARNSYAAGAPSAQTLGMAPALGQPVTLFRAGFQADIGAGGYTAGAGFTGLSGSYGRIFVTVIPAPASLALLGLGGLVAIRRRR